MDTKTQNAIIDDLLKKHPEGPAGCTLTFTKREEYDYDRHKYRTHYTPSDPAYGYGAATLFSIGFRNEADVSQYIRDRFFDGKGEYELGRRRSTVTRRTNRIWERIRTAVTELQKEGGKGIYQINESSYNTRTVAYLHALNPEEAGTLAELFLRHPRGEGYKFGIKFIEFGDAIRLHEYNAKIREAAQVKVVSMERQIASATKSIEDVTSLMATLDTLEGHQIALDMGN